MGLTPISLTLKWTFLQLSLATKHQPETTAAETHFPQHLPLASPTPPPATHLSTLPYLLLLQPISAPVLPLPPMAPHLLLMDSTQWRKYQTFRHHLLMDLIQWRKYQTCHRHPQMDSKQWRRNQTYLHRLMDLKRQTCLHLLLDLKKWRKNQTCLHLLLDFKLWQLKKTGHLLMMDSQHSHKLNLILWNHITGSSQIMFSGVTNTKRECQLSYIRRSTRPPVKQKGNILFIKHFYSPLYFVPFIKRFSAFHRIVKKYLDYTYNES